MDDKSPLASTAVRIVFAVAFSLLALAIVALALASIGWLILQILTHMPLIGGAL